jgi:hypothetical protein
MKPGKALVPAAGNDAGGGIVVVESTRQDADGGLKAP